MCVCVRVWCALFVERGFGSELLALMPKKKKKERNTGNNRMNFNKRSDVSRFLK